MTELRLREVRKKTGKEHQRGKPQGVSLRPGDRQTFQILAEAKKLSVSDVMYYLVARGAKDFLADGLLIHPQDIINEFDPLGGAKVIMDRLRSFIANDPAYTDARDVILNERIPRTSAEEFEPGDFAKIQKIED